MAGHAPSLRRIARGYAASDRSGVLSPFTFTRRSTGPDEVTIKVLYCGFCHTDLHHIRNEWGDSVYPLVPGHEIAGTVAEVGGNVKNFKVGDRVGVGIVLWSCHQCEFCRELQEQYCPKVIWTYNDVYLDGTRTQGGFSNMLVIDQRFVLRIPDNLPLDASAPLLCAGITVYHPMMYFGMAETGKTLGVVGLGGLGHMAVKFGKAFGMEVTVISRSPGKEKDARESLGADHFIISNDNAQMQKAANTLDFIIDTAPAAHPLEPLLALLKDKGKLVLVGVPPTPLQLISRAIVTTRCLLAGSLVGGIQETQDMLDFCSQNNITSTIEKIPVSYVNTATDRLSKGDVRYRFVLDVGNTLEAKQQQSHTKKADAKYRIVLDIGNMEVEQRHSCL